MKKTLLAVSGAGLAGLAVFVLVNFSTVKLDKQGVNVEVGGGKAHAGCYEDGPNCLPALDFTDEEGKVWTREGLSDKVVIINFWASWCHPCQREIPDLARTFRKYKDKNVVLLGFLTDDISATKLAAVRKQFGLDYPVVRVTPDISRAFGSPRNLPTNFVYDRGGNLIYDRPGAITAGDLEKEIKELL